MTHTTYVLRSERVAARRIGDELMIMSAQDSSLFSLNETAALLWEAADGLTPLAQIVERDICPAFDIDVDTALADAHDLALALAEHGILLMSDHPIDSSTVVST
jgi:hypothetical protein